MTDTTFVDKQGIVSAAWLNDINIAIYRALGTAGVSPTTAAQVLANLGFLAPSGAGLIGYTFPTSYAAGTVGAAIKGLSVDVKSAFGAKGDGLTDDTAAIQAAINALTTGAIIFPLGRYIVTNNLFINKPGITLMGAAPAGQGAVTSYAVSEIVASGPSCTCPIHFGDPAEATAVGAHLYPGGAILNLAVTGSTFTTSAVRIYNASVVMMDCYVSNVVASGGIGVWMKNAWLSKLLRCFIQSTAAHDLWLDVSSNSVNIDDCTFLSPSGDGVHITGGSNSIGIRGCDFEGKVNGISFDVTSAFLDNISVELCNFESNTGTAITSTGGQVVNGLMLQNIRCAGAGNGIALNFLNASRIDQLFLNNCDLNFGQIGQTVDMGKIYLSGSAAITGQQTSIRPRKVTEALYEDNSTVGALSYTLDASLYNVLELNLIAACTTVSFTINNTTSRFTGEELLIMLGNSTTATAGGSVTLPAAFKKSAALVIPATGKRSLFRFLRDSNNLWWECARLTDVE